MDNSEIAPKSRNENEFRVVAAPFPSVFKEGNELASTAF
jgi:hypothetical protein